MKPKNPEMLKEYTRTFLAITITGFLGGFLFMLGFREIPKDNSGVILTLGGMFFAGFAGIVFYYFNYRKDKGVGNDPTLPQRERFCTNIACPYEAANAEIPTTA